jgi:cytochrome c5
MKRYIASFFFASAILVCCKSTAPLPLTPGPQDEAIAKTKWSDADLTQLNTGYKLYNENCGKCHVLHNPTEYDESRWTKIVPWMGKKANLQEADQQLILHYLLAKREVLLSTKK